MAGEFEFRVRNTEEVAAAIAKVPGIAFKELRSTFQKIGRGFVTDMRVNRLSGRPGLKVQTGTLRRSLSSATVGAELADLRTVVFFDLSATRLPNGSSYALVHEYGATIRPKNGKYLTIPFRAGSGFMGGAKTKSFSSQIAGFRKVRQVYIPPRLKFFESWNSELNQRFIGFRLQVALDSIVKKAKEAV